MAVRGRFPVALGMLLRRLHFYIGLFVGPFLLVAALSGIGYALTPQIEARIYASALHADSPGQAMPLAHQVQAAQAFVGAESTVFAVRPAPHAGDTTRVMFSVPGYGASESRAIFIDPASAEVKGDLKVYGTSGVLPIRTWLDQFHRNLMLGEAGRLYSELAASWLWVAALGGLYLWAQRRGSGRGVLQLHSVLGLTLLLGLLFFSATGLTWSRLAGDNIGVLRKEFGWATPSVSTQLDGQAKAMADEHAEHHMQMMAHEHAGHGVAPMMFDHMLQAARAAGIDAAKVELRPPQNDTSAWTVSEVDRSWPTQVDAVAIDPRNLQVVDRVDFAQYPLAAKLTRWGVDAHVGVLFGLPNQVLLALTGVGVVLMTGLGYLLWWRRSSRGRQPTLVDAWRAFGPGARVGIALAGVLLGISLPLFGICLLAFIASDLIVTMRQGRRRFVSQQA